MTSLLERVRAAWSSGDPLALHREVEGMAVQGNSRESIEEALESLLGEIRSAGASDEAEELINGVWDRLSGWCHASGRIVTQMKGTSQVNGRGAQGTSIESTKSA